MAVYENIKQCSQAENIPSDILKACRPHLPAAFNHGRVNFDLAKPYIDANYDMLQQEADETLDALKKQRLKQQMEREKYSFDIEKQKYIEKDMVIQRIKEIGASQKIILKDSLLETLPARLVGLSQADILIELEKVFQNICKEMNTLKI